MCIGREKEAEEEIMCGGSKNSSRSENNRLKENATEDRNIKLVQLKIKLVNVKLKMFKK